MPYKNFSDSQVSTGDFGEIVGHARAEYQIRFNAKWMPPQHTQKNSITKLFQVFVVYKAAAAADDDDVFLFTCDSLGQVFFFARLWCRTSRLFRFYCIESRGKFEKTNNAYRITFEIVCRCFWRCKVMQRLEKTNKSYRLRQYTWAKATKVIQMRLLIEIHSQCVNKWNGWTIGNTFRWWKWS